MQAAHCHAAFAVCDLATSRVVTRIPGQATRGSNTHSSGLATMSRRSERIVLWGPALAAWLQHHNRYFSRRLLLILRKVRHEGRLGVVQPLALLALCSARVRNELVHAGLRGHFDAHLRIRQDVAVPVGMCRRAAFGGDDHVVVAVARERKRIDPLLTTFGAPGREQQQSRALEHARRNLAVVAAELRDNVAIDVVPYFRRSCFTHGYRDVKLHSGGRYSLRRQCTRQYSTPQGLHRIQACRAKPQAVAPATGAVCSTTSASTKILISWLTTSRLSASMSNSMPKSLRLIWPSAPKDTRWPIRGSLTSP